MDVNTPRVYNQGNNFSSQPEEGEIQDDPVIDCSTYFIQRAKEIMKTSPLAAEAWKITAKIVYPQNFDVLFEAYLLEKDIGNASEAAKTFDSLFQLFMSENKLWNEIRDLTVSLLSSDDTKKEVMFYKEMFSSLPPATQHDILSLTSEKSEDTMEHCKIVLLMINKFPESTIQLRTRLMDTLLTTEKHAQCSSVMNCYRKTLIKDVLPLIMERNVELTTKQSIRLLHKTMEFYLAFFMMNIKTAVDNSLSDLQLEEKLVFTWENMFSAVKLFMSKLDWELHTNVVYPWDREIVWQNIMTFQNTRMNAMEPVKAQKQLIFCVTLFFSCALCHYNTHLYLGTASKSPVVLVEGFTTSNANSERVEKILKKTKYDVTTDSKPPLTVGNNNTEIIRHFLFIVKCWEMLNSSESFQKDFIKLKHHIHLELWLSDFVFDQTLYSDKIEDYPIDMLQNTVSIRNAIQRLSFYYCLKCHDMSVKSAIQVLKLLHTVPRLGMFSTSVTRETSGRHLHYLPVEQLPILQYVTKIIFIPIKKALELIDRQPQDKLIEMKNVNRNRLYCQLLTLSQLNWPTERAVTMDILHRIREAKFLYFPSFSKYIINIDILEEFMFMINTEPYIKLDISDPSIKYMQPAGMEMQKKVIRNQVNKCNDLLHMILANYLIEEENFLPRVQI